MQLVRASLERLLLLLFGAARSIFLLQGVAFGSACGVVLATAPSGNPAWLREVLLSTLLVSGTFFVGALLLISTRGWSVPQASSGSEPAWPWPVLLGLSLLALSALAASAAAPLLRLWSEAAAKLEAAGFWNSLAHPGPYDGFLMLPILLALFVPALVTAAAVFSIAFPIVLLPLLPARSRLFPALLAMGAICQAALVLGGWLAADAFARLAEHALAAMATAPDAEVLRSADELRRATGFLTSTASALVAPLLGLLAWLMFLRPSGAASAYFTKSASPAQAPHAMQPDPVAQPPPVSTSEAPRLARRRAAQAPRAPVGRTRLALAALGAFMLLFGAADALRTRASYVSSQPVPGAMLEQPPAAVRVSFGTALDPASSLSLTRLVLPPYAGEQPKDVEIPHHIAPQDPGRRTLEAASPRLPAGLYRVSWRALPADGGVPRVGSFCFGVGVPVPTDDANVTHSLQDHDIGARGRRHTFAGGALLLALGVLMPLLR